MTTHAIANGLKIATQMHEDLILVTLAGPLDNDTVPGFRIDSSGLGAQVGLRRQGQRDGPELSQTWDLLVVGSRHWGSVDRLLLDSTPSSLVGRAYPC